ncbi:ParB/RepB/Spo0J family partition protein [Streptomyces palmae]|uniref:Chromosome partitioning protein ParB n=1 Tax=Streptomyces palmae TaxID=1701085 RepID=A0A4Z0HCI5_9ACTN|nr:ParB N-terminal domain-containing protein [Streptomyces palmae]TGB14601.1 chromosome partitioning protein ParB [Streptomyces palmae]
MAGALPRPKRKSTKSKPVVAPDEVLYTDTDRSGDTLDLELSSLCPNPFNKRAKRGVPELAATIKEVGLLQSIAHITADVWLKIYPETRDQITAPNVILFGEHRWLAYQELASQEAGWETIPSVLRDDKVEDARLITLIENLRRAQLSPLEEAEHYQALREAGLSYEQIAGKVGETANGAISKGTVWKRIKLLDLAPAVQQALRDGTLRVSAAEKAQQLDHDDQEDYLSLVRGGTHPAEAQAQILARQRQDEAPDTASPVSTGNGGAEPAADKPETVSTGNGAPAAPPAPRKPKQAKQPSGRDKDEADRRAAAVAREASCRALLEVTDVTDPANSDLILSVLTAAVLAPPQQSAAQQRAFTWLKETSRHGLDAADAATYFAAIQDSGDAAVQRLAAFAAALAAAELRTAARRQSWGSRERNHVRVLQEHADYEPQTEWEKAELGLVAAGETR